MKIWRVWRAWHPLPHRRPGSARTAGSRLQRFAWRSGYALPILLLALAAMAPIAVRAVSATPWNLSGGPGITTIVSDGTSGPAEFQYNYDLGIGGGVSGTWGFATTADASGPVQLNWQYTGHHSFFQVRVGLHAYVTSLLGADTDLTLVDAGPTNCCTPPSGGFAYCGTTTLNVEPGDVYGFTLSGSNVDLNSFLHGTLLVDVNPAGPPDCSGDGTVTVATDHDDGTCTPADCTLREAINAANAQANGSGPDTIDFDLGAGTHTITLASALPPITDPVVIDGDAPPVGPACAVNPLVTLDGSSAGAGAHGLEFQAGGSGSTVRGLAISGFDGDGILANGGGLTIECNAITANGAGVVVASAASGVRIEGNAIADNASLGIDLEGDLVSANDTLDPDSGSNQLQNYPVLAGAIPGPGGGIVGRINTTPLTTVEVLFYVGTTCDPNGYGEGAALIDGITVTTDANGDAPLGLLTSDIPDNSFVTATATGPDGSTSEFSACVPSGYANDDWTRALDVSGGPNPVNGFIDSGGRARWYKFTITPGSRVQVDLSTLPANYDLSLFKDIGQAYVSLSDPGALTRLSAEFAPSQFSPSQFSPSQFSSSQFSPDAYAPSQFSPSQFSPSMFSPSQFSPSQFSPSQFSPSQFSPSQFSPSQFSPSQFSPSQFSSNVVAPSQFSANAFASAQVRSLVAVSAVPGTGNESLTADTWNNTGYFYVRVSGRDGAFDPTHAFTLAITRSGSNCGSVTPQGSAPAAAASTSVSGTPLKTVILIDSTRIVGTPTEKSTLLAKLNAFGLQPDVAGVVIDVASQSRIVGLNSQADTHADCPYAKNLVADATKDVVDSYRPNNPSLAYVVIVGGDTTIPFFRYADQALLGPESDYVPPVGSTTASEASLRLNYVLSQDAYGAGTEISLRGGTFPVPGLAVGRIVETAAEASGMIDAYTALTAGVVATPTSSLVTGYDFLADAATAVQSDLEIGTGQPADTLIAPNNISPQDPAAWTAAQLKAKLLGSRHDLIFLAGHFSANSALAADFSTSVLTTDLAASAVNLANSIVFSAGCHSGYNIVDGDIITNVTQPLDWAQAFAQKRATLIAGTGYQYGDTDFIEYSERIYASFAHQLRTGTGAVSVGQALVEAKQAYLRQTPDIRGIHEKAILEATLFGLPMLRVNMPGVHDVSGAAGSIVGATTSYATDPGLTLGLTSADVTITPDSAVHHVAMKPVGGGPDLQATYYSGTDGVTSNPAEPALPLESRNVTVPGTTLRGVGFRGGTYDDSTVIPLTGAATTDLRGVHSAFSSPVFYPMRTWTTNYYDALDGGATRLLVTPAQHRSLGFGQNDSILRLFSGMSFRLFYSANTGSFGPNIPALAAPPSVSDVDASTDGLTIEFRAHVVGDPAAGIQGVWVTYTGWGHTWTSLDLTQDPSDSTLWTGSLAIPGGKFAEDLRFMVQAVNGVGLVNLDDNLGSFYAGPGAAIVAPTASSLSLDAAPASGTYGDVASIGATLIGPGPLQGQTVQFTVGGASQSDTTDANGRATVQIPLALVPGPYSLSASFAGDATYLPSSDSHGFSVAKLGTTVVLTGPASAVSGANSGIIATLKDANGHELPQRTVYFVVTRAGGPSVTKTAITDYLGRASLGSVNLAPNLYTVTAYFLGSIPLLPSAATVDLSDPIYTESAATTPLTLVNPVATVSSVVPGSIGRGALNVPISIVGTGFVAGSTVTISGSGVTASTSYVDATHLTALVSVTSGAATTNRNVIVTNPGVGSGTCTNCLNINLGPYGFSALPTEMGRAAVNENISIVGFNFVSGTWTPSSVVFSGAGITVNSVTRVNSLVLIVNLSIDPAAATTNRSLTVINPDGGRSTTSNGFNVLAAPSITSLNPNSRGQGAVSENIVITGTNFRTGPWPNSAVSFSGTGITVNSVSRTDSTHLTVNVSIAAGAAIGARDVNIRNVDAGRATLAGAFTVNVGPAITSLAPNSRGQGATSQVITITGSNFLAGAWSTSAVSFSGSGITVNSVSRTDANHLAVNISIATSASTGARTVTVRNLDGGRATLAAAFTVTARPTLTSLNPSSRARGQANQTIVLAGTGFLNGAAVAFSGSGITVNSVTWNSATKLTISISVSGGASTGFRNVTVTNPDQGSFTLSNGFRVT